MARRRPATSDSRTRLLAAAREEFAARGFDGAKVDRIALRAGLNKAMLYYHFGSKASLYREILRDLFHGVAEAVSDVRASRGTPQDRLRQFIQAIAANGIEQPHFPAIWLREMADGGRRLDRTVLAEISNVLGVLAAILKDGQAAGVFRKVDPFVTHIGIVAPLTFFVATAPVRRRFADQGPARIELPMDVIVAHVQDSTLAVLAPTGRTGRAGAAPSRTR